MEGPSKWLQPKKHALNKLRKLMTQFWDNVDTVTVPSTVSEAGVFQRTLVRVFLDLFRNGKSFEAEGPIGQRNSKNHGMRTWVHTIEEESLLDTWTLSDEWYKFLIKKEYQSRTHKDIVGNNSVEKAHLFKQRVEKSYLIFKFGLILVEEEALADYEGDIKFYPFGASEGYLLQDFCDGTTNFYNNCMKRGSYKSIETGYVEDKDKKPISLEEQRRIMDLVIEYLVKVERFESADKKHRGRYLRKCMYSDTQGLSITAGEPNPFFVSI